MQDPSSPPYNKLLTPIRKQRPQNRAPQAKRFRINERIRVPELMVIDADGEKKGVMKTADALALAQEHGLDLIEVSPLAQPPVARILDYGQFQYQQSKSVQKQRKVDTKQIKISFKMGAHDIEVRQKQADKFFQKGHKVKLLMRLRGREKAMKQLANQKMHEFITTLPYEVKIEKSIAYEGGQFQATIVKQ